MALEMDTITTLDEYEKILGIQSPPFGFQLPITRAGYKDQIKRGRSDGDGFLLYGAADR